MLKNRCVMEENYRCHETIDLEDMIKMKQEQFCTKSTAKVYWKSGRIEEFSADLNKGGEFKKSFADKVAAHKAFPTVERVEVEKA